MRQAGRSLPEYRALRGEGSILDAIRDPDLAAEITLQPVRRYGVDAAILYSDIVVPAAAIGFGVDVTPGIGPVVTEPFRVAGRPRPPAPLRARGRRALRRRDRAPLVAELGDTPLIGFAGAPFTVASYLIEGRPSRTYGLTKAMLHGEPTLWHALLDRLADIAIASLRAQVEAGASAIQLFDSWAGALVARRLRAARAAPQRQGARGRSPTCRASTSASAPASCSRSWATPAPTWSASTGACRSTSRAQRVPGKAVQGNLDPAVCLAPWDVVADRTRDVLRRNAGRPGHIFNLGHGVLPELDPGVLKQVVDLVHEEGRTDG